MNVQYGVIQVDSTIIRRKFRAPSVDSYAIDNSQTTTYDEYYTLNQDCWAIHKILFNTSSIYTQQYEAECGSSDTVVIDNCSNIYKMYGVGIGIATLKCKVYND